MKLILATALAAVALSSAQAQETDLDWSGAYFGANVGFGSAPARLDGMFTLHTADIPSSGASGGVFAGHNWIVPGAFIFSLEADFQFGGPKGRGPILFAGTPIPGSSQIETDYRWQAGLNARVGIDAGRWMPYITTGFAATEVQHDFRTGATHSVIASNQYNGWSVGAGIDVALTEGVFLRAEYRYTDFGTVENRNPGFVFHDLAVRSSDFRLGIASKF